MERGDHSACEQLLRLARGGDQDSLGQLLEMYRTYLALLSRLEIGRHIQGRVDASDLVQETFLAATRGFGGFRGATEAELIAWLRQIMASKLADLVRRNLGTQGRDARLERRLAHEMDHSSRALGDVLFAPQSTPSQHAAKREQSVLLADALDTLMEEYREVLVLRHLEGLSFQQVAQRMGRTVDSVKNLWTRGLVELRRSLGGFQ